MRSLVLTTRCLCLLSAISHRMMKFQKFNIFLLLSNQYFYIELLKTIQMPWGESFLAGLRVPSMLRLLWWENDFGSYWVRTTDGSLNGAKHNLSQNLCLLEFHWGTVCWGQKVRCGMTWLPIHWLHLRYLGFKLSKDPSHHNISLNFLFFSVCRIEYSAGCCT